MSMSRLALNLSNASIKAILQLTDNCVGLRLGCRPLATSPSKFGRFEFVVLLMFFEHDIEDRRGQDYLQTLHLPAIANGHQKSDAHYDTRGVCYAPVVKKTQ